MSFNYSPNIVTDGLVLYLDAANSKSIVSGATTWTDLSRGGNNGTLVNGPTFNSGNGGSIVFDGSDDYVNVAHNTTLDLTQTFTISFWIYPTRSNTQDYIFNKNDAWGVIIGYQQGFVNFYNNAYQPTAISTQIPVTLNQWTNIVYSKGLNSLSNNWNGYKDGLSVFSLTRSFTNSTNTSALTIGSSQVNLNFYNGNISICQLYNRALSSQEVLQNYNTTKSRFGL